MSGKDWHNIKLVLGMLWRHNARLLEEIVCYFRKDKFDIVLLINGLRINVNYNYILKFKQNGGIDTRSFVCSSCNKNNHNNI